MLKIWSLVISPLEGLVILGSLKWPGLLLKDVFRLESNDDEFLEPVWNAQQHINLQTMSNDRQILPGVR
jgi:hypothetical protein